MHQFLEDKIDIQIKIFEDIIMQQQEMIHKQQELIDHLHKESKTSMAFSIVSLTIACVSVAVPFVIKFFSNENGKLIAMRYKHLKPKPLLLKTIFLSIWCLSLRFSR